MRRLKLEVQLSMDGFAADVEGKTDWMVWHWQPEWSWDKPLQVFHTGLQTSSDTVLLGKNMAAGDFYRHWQEIAQNKENPQQEFAKAIVAMKRVAFSKKLKKSPWKDVELLKGDLKEEIMKLKKREGKDIIVYGGTRFVSSLIKEDLIDEYNLFVNPTILGKGKPIFKSVTALKNLHLVGATSYECGVVVLTYTK